VPYQLLLHILVHKEFVGKRNLNNKFLPQCNILYHTKNYSAGVAHCLKNLHFTNLRDNSQRRLNLLQHQRFILSYFILDRTHMKATQTQKTAMADLVKVL
jgi:hypothetical protein